MTEVEVVVVVAAAAAVAAVEAVAVALDRPFERLDSYWSFDASLVAVVE